MGVYRKRSRQTPQPSVELTTVPASVGGINALNSLIAMPPQDCIYCDNLMPSEYGLRLRKGYAEWANGIAGEVRTIIPFEGQSSDAAEDRLWCVTEDGIYNVTLSNTIAPVAVVDFPNQGVEAGWGVSTEFTNDAGERILQYADGANGLHQYDESTGLWTIPAPTGVDPAKVAFVTLWKNRLWYIENDSGDAWYLGLDASTGAATKFTFASKFTHGGDLRGLWSWTIDGGAGVDDYLIAISRGGDVLVYSGSDPDLADFSLVGSFFIGEVPESRRLAVEYAGDLYLLSTYGITSLRDLLQGAGIVDVASSPSAKISRFLRQLVQDNKDQRNWGLFIHPADGFLQVITPFSANKEPTQYTQNLLTSAWGRWEGVPINCAQTWNGNYMFGTLDGQVYIYDGTLDNTLLDGTGGDPINFDILTSFQAPGNHGTWKNVGFIRTVGVLAGTAAINVKAVYDYDVGAQLRPPPPLQSSGESLWDEAIWDTNVWDFGLQAANFPTGALGIGRSVAIGMKGSSATRINVLGWDLTYVTGAPL